MRRVAIAERREKEQLVVTKEKQLSKQTIGNQKGRLENKKRYCMVLFAGIAAEALVYGEAEGGENDENLFRNICLLLEPRLSLTEVSPQCTIDTPVLMMSNQERWSVLQTYNLPKWHRAAHRAAIKMLESGASLSIGQHLFSSYKVVAADLKCSWFHWSAYSFQMPLCWTLYRMKECHAANK
ncbi:hypothetical protein HN873_038658 [Arachis hypogaea]